MEGAVTGAPSVELAGLLREVSIALALWRLFPGEEQRPEIQNAFTRARVAAQPALADGPVRLAVDAGGFKLRGQQLAGSTHLQRFARACYDRRVSYLDVRDVPKPDELTALFAVLTKTVEELDALGGAQAALAAAGVTALALWEGPPAALADEDVDRGGGATAAVAELLADLHGVRAGDELYDRLSAAAEHVTDATTRAQFLSAAYAIVSTLDLDERGRFGQRVLQDSEEAAFAQHYLGHLTDPAMAALVAEAAALSGVDPAAFAQQIVTRSDRHSTVTKLVEAGMRRREDAPSVQPVLDAPTQLGVADAAAALAMHHSLVESVPGASRDAELAGLAGEYRQMSQELRAIALQALSDYIRLEEDGERLHHVMMAVARRLQKACEDRDLEWVQALVAALGDRGRQRLDAYQVVDARTITDLVEHSWRRSDTGALAQMVELLGRSAVEAVVDALAGEQRRDVRAMLLSLLGKVGAAHGDVLRRRLEDSRWFVVRNVASVLGKLGGVEDADALMRLAHHEHPRVRAEAAQALAMALGSSHVEDLAQLAGRHDEAGYELVVAALRRIPSAEAAQALTALVRIAPSKRALRHVLESLAEHPHDAATGLLGEIASAKGGFRLPWSARRRARKLARMRRAAP